MNKFAKYLVTPRPVPDVSIPRYIAMHLVAAVCTTIGMGAGAIALGVLWDLKQKRQAAENDTTDTETHQ